MERAEFLEVADLTRLIDDGRNPHGGGNAGLHPGSAQTFERQLVNIADQEVEMNEPVFVFCTVSRFGSAYGDNIAQAGAAKSLPHSIMNFGDIGGVQFPLGDRFAK